ncbi:hypothetical protein K443DRAFT_15620 [Laccaria amethystina LaAM-08-1]|uniref:Uncharacterized protein n=1 Tax=Laccaria amethystina LaAM-08-1 TaxID=1095629 RepID=A0A0C9WXB3_9AGAR|nr:hypothetical protein K443DRAFT_15620 [Laccaria amethystina LaAM-08-1]
MTDGEEKIQKIGSGMYLRSPHSGLATAIHFYRIRQTFHSLTGNLSSIPHSLPPLFSSLLLSSLLHSSLPRPSLSPLPDVAQHP